MVNGALAEPMLFVACNVNANDPAMPVGVPLIRPLLPDTVLSVRPGGNAPLITVYVIGLALSGISHSALYGTAVCAGGMANVPHAGTLDATPNCNPVLKLLGTTI